MRLTRREFFAAVSTTVAMGLVGGCQCTEDDGSEDPPPRLPLGKHIVWIGVSGIPDWYGDESESYAVDLALTTADDQPVVLETFVGMPLTPLYYGHVQLDTPDPVSITARATLVHPDGERSEGQPISRQVDAGYPASVRVLVSAATAAAFMVVRDESSRPPEYSPEQYVLDRRSSLFAIVAPRSVVSDPDVLGRLFDELGQRGVRIDPSPKSTEPMNKEVFFLFDVSKLTSIETREVFDMVLGYARHLEQDRIDHAPLLLGIVVRQQDKRTRLLVLDQRPLGKKEYSVVISKLPPLDPQGRKPVDEFVRRARGNEAKLRFLDEAATHSSRPRSPPPPRPTRDSVHPPRANLEVPGEACSDGMASAQGADEWKVQTGYVPALEKLKAADRLNGDHFDLPIAVATVEAGLVDRKHPWVDRANLIQVVICGGELKVVNDESMPTQCGVGNEVHATAIYGLLSALDPQMQASLDGEPGLQTELALSHPCPTGAVPGVRHIAMYLPRPPADSPPGPTCREIADALRWLAGLDTDRDWPSISDLGGVPARVINISQQFPAVLKLPPDSSDKKYLVTALNEIATISHGNLGALVVTTIENASDALLVEDELSMPCRNSHLVAGAARETGGNTVAASLAWSPTVSIVAPATTVDLLDVPGSEARGCGVGLGPHTSYAAPMVSAAAIMVMAAKPEITAPEVARTIRNTASVVEPNATRENRWFEMQRDRISKGPETASMPAEGSESLNGDLCWTSLRFGQGNLNILAAVKSALGS